MYVSFLVAHDLNRVIGANDTIPWRLPDDMRWFRKKSIGKPVILGRKTYESIPAKFRPLPQRHNIILTRNREYIADGATVVHSAAAALAVAGDVEEVIVGGGAAVYELFLPLVNRIYLTVVNGRFPGDTYFPKIDHTNWRETFRQPHPADARHAVSFEWVVLEKVA